MKIIETAKRIPAGHDWQSIHLIFYYGSLLVARKRREKIVMMTGFLDNIVISSEFIFSLVASFQTKEQWFEKFKKSPLPKNGIKQKFLTPLTTLKIVKSIP